MTRVLVVDDHTAVAEAVAQMVRATGCEAAITHNGSDAMDLLRGSGADLVVLDVSMPGMSGLDVLRAMRAEGMLVQTRVLMFSASEEYRDRSLRLGAAGFVLKDEVDDLIQKIGRILRCQGLSPDPQPPWRDRLRHEHH